MPGGNYKKQFTEDQKALIKKMYVEDGEILVAVRDHIKCSISRLKDFLIEEGILRSQDEVLKRRGKAIALKFTDDERADIIDQFNKGVRIFNIVKQYQCTYVPIYNCLIDGGVDLTQTYLRTSKTIQKLLADRKAKGE